MTRQFGGFTQGRQGDKVKVIFAVVMFILIFSIVALLYVGGETPAPQTAAVVVQQNEPAVKQREVLIPIQRLETGVALDPAQFRKEMRPELSLSPRVITGFEQIAGHYARSIIPAGEPLIMDYVTTVKPTNPLTANIPEGFRAVTININATSGVEGWAVSGSKVDVVWASHINGKPGVTVIVQNAKVLSAGKMMNGDVQPGAPVPSTVTLLVSSDDANKILLAQTSGSLSLSLRGDTDGKGTEGGSLTVDDLLGKEEGVDAQRKREGVVKVRGPNGQMEEMILENGRLVPLAQE